MTPLRQWGTTAAVVVAVAGSVALGLASGAPRLHVALITGAALAYCLSGVVARARRPRNRLGPLMLLTGAVWLASTLSWSTNPAVLTIGRLVDLVPLVAVLHVFLAFPTGALHSGFERVLVATGYGVALGGQLVTMALGGFGADAPLAVVDLHDAAVVVHGLALVVISLIALAGVAVLRVRQRTSGPPLRRSIRVLVQVFALGLVMVAVLLVAGVLGAPAFPVLQRLSVLALGLAPLVFLAGLLDARLRRAAVGDLVLALQDGPQDLRAPLARALRDPSLTVAYWLPEFGVWADAQGTPVPLHDEPDGRASTVIERAGRPVAVLVHDPALRDEPELLDAVTAAAGLALENARLRAEQQAQLEELRGSRVRVLEAGQRERQRLERDLHDGAQQRLVALSMDLGALEHRLGGDAEAAAIVAQAKREVASSLAELRDLAHGLHPAVLTAHGLPVALESLAARAPVPVRLDVDVPQRLDEAVEVAAYYVVCESLANIGKHAHASAARVAVRGGAGSLLVEVADDGVGGADRAPGSGLRGLADRVEALRGRFAVATPPGGGTLVRAELPCA